LAGFFGVVVVRIPAPLPFLIFLTVFTLLTYSIILTLVSTLVIDVLWHH